MTFPVAPDSAAVLIVEDVLGFHACTDPDAAKDVVAALARAGWLHDPAEGNLCTQLYAREVQLGLHDGPLPPGA